MVRCAFFLCEFYGVAFDDKSLIAKLDMYVALIFYDMGVRIFFAMLKSVKRGWCAANGEHCLAGIF